MAQGRFPLMGSSVSEKGGDGAGGKQCTEEAVYGGKGGKLRLSRISLFKKKPYDRPLPSGNLDRRQISSLPARLVDSASNLLTSSASYLFESFFKRRQARWIGNGTHSTVGWDSTDAQRYDGSKPVTDNANQERHTIEEGGGGKVGGEDTCFEEVEEFLKQQSLSREEVKRLTEVLQTQGYGGNIADSNPEASRRLNMIKQVSKESNPVQLAKAYMGKRTSPQWQPPPTRLSEVPGPYTRKSLQNGNHEKSSSDALGARATPGRMLKRRLIADDEDDIVLTVPTRRVRQKMTVTANSSPYLRQVTAVTGRPQTPRLAVLKPTDKLEKSPGMSVEPFLPSKGKSVEELATLPAGTSISEDLPESSKARDSEHDSNRESFVLPTSSDAVKPNCSPPEPVETIALEKSVSVPLAASSPELPAILPERTSKAKGFHISALFEDSSSDDEANVPAKVSSSSEAKLFGAFVHKEGQEESMTKQPDNVPYSSAAESAEMPVSVVQQPSLSTGPSSFRFNNLLSVSSADRPLESPFTVSNNEKSTFTLPSSIPFSISAQLSSSKPVSVDSQLPVKIDKNDGSSDVPASISTSLLVASSVSLLPSPMPPPSASLILPWSEAEAAAAVISLPLETTPVKDPVKKESAKRKVEATQTGTPEASGLFSASASQPMPVSFENVTPLIADPEAASKISASAEVSAMFGLPKPLFAATPAPIPAVNQASPSETQLINVPPTDSPLASAGIRHSPMFESPSTENRQSDMDTMATDPMTEEPPAPITLFGSSSNAMSMPAGETATFGSHSTPSPFSFPMQSSTPSEVTQSPFNSQSSSAAGQLFSFGASGPTPANPFSASSQSAFSFGSSATASMFPATSSAPLTFPATSSAPPPFLFGAQASSSSVTTSVFGGQTTPSASGFTGGGAQNNASAFAFQATPSTPSAPSFQFGGTSAGSSSLPSTPSFGAQPFAFNGQPANPFTQSGGTNASPFQFGAAASQPAFSSAVAPASNFSFGAPAATQPASPFTFGGQSTASSAGQPFGFGGQPAAPQPSPFVLPGSTSHGPPVASGMDYAGGFSLGAAGGEKSGRKFIKAKRIVKRGK